MDEKKPMSNFVNPRIKFGKPVKPGTAAVFAAADDDDADVNVTFDASTGTVSLDATGASISMNKNKATIGFNLSADNLPGGASAQIAGIEFSKPDEPTGTFDASNVFEDKDSFTDGDGNTHSVYGKWKNGQHKLKMVDDDNVAAGESEKDYGYKVWVMLTPSGGAASYFSSPDPEVKNEPTTGGG